MSRGEEVRRMFDAIAWRYDLMNRLMTLGQDQRWRRFVVKQSGLEDRGAMLDLACGTGDITAAAHHSHPHCTIVGADFSPIMLHVAKKRFSHLPIHWQMADAYQLPFRSGSLSAVTFGYLLRNVDEPVAVLREVHRVLAPGGRVVCLDTTPPRSLMRPLTNFHFRVIIPLLGRLVAGDHGAYQYLTGSTMGFYEADQLAGLFTEAGFSAVGFRKFMLGTIAVHWGVCSPS
jgi:demethylmenaquinone methyltransferase/2-methoxy-6-polyprenyl-1,4-benzoquinol methylase